MMGEAPSVALARITDAAGNVIFASEDKAAAAQLSPEEKAQIALIRAHEPHVFSFGNGRREGVKAICDGANIRGYAWVETDHAWDTEQLKTVLRGSFSFGLIWIGASGLLVLLMSRSISRPLSVLQGGTRALMDWNEREFSFAGHGGQRVRGPDPGIQSNGGGAGGTAIGIERHAVAAGFDAGECADRAGVLRSAMQNSAGKSGVRGDDGRCTEPAPGSHAAGSVAGAHCDAT